MVELQTATTIDDILKTVLSHVWAQWLPKQQIPVDLLAYYHTRNELHVEQDCLARDCQFILLAPTHFGTRSLWAPWGHLDEAQRA